MSNIRVMKNYINEEWIESKSTETIDVINPATKEGMVKVPARTNEELDKAALNAQDVLERWSNTDVNKRARILFRYQQLLQDNKNELAKLITMENGKSVDESLGEVQRGIENVEFAAGAPSLM